MTQINNGGSAFPGGLYEPQYGGTNDREPFNQGMSLRDWFAGQALAGMMSATDNTGLWTATCAIKEAAGFAYSAADAMLAARDGSASV